MANTKMSKAKIKAILLEKIRVAEGNNLKNLSDKEFEKQVRWVVATYQSTIAADSYSRNDWVDIFLQGIKPCKVADVVDEVYDSQDGEGQTIGDTLDEIVAMTYG